MKNISIEIKNEYKSEYTIINFNCNLKLYSEVKIFIPKVNGKPTLEKGKRWYVYYRFYNHQTRKKELIKDYCNLHSFKTFAERKAWAINNKNAITLLLSKGFNPFTKNGIEPKQFDKKTYSVTDAINYALDNLKGTWKESTYNDYKTRANLFLQWTTSNNVGQSNVELLDEFHIISFFNWLVMPLPHGRGVGLTSQDNYKRCLAALFNKLVRDKVLKKNFVATIETKKNKPTKNAPFTGHEVKLIKEYLLNNDLKLYYFIQFVVYTFLRPVEIMRLTVGSFKLDQKTLTVETKTEKQKVKKLIAPILSFLELKKIDKLPKKAHLFTMSDVPEVWDASEKTKVDYMAARFRTMKTALGFGSDYGVYSFRHTAAIDLYYSFLKQGLSERETILKLMPITGHATEAALSKYLRDVGGMLPKDYSADYTLDF